MGTASERKQVIGSSKMQHAVVAQLVEHVIGEQQLPAILETEWRCPNYG